MEPRKRAEYTKQQTRLVKIGARVIETVARISIVLASACRDQAMIAQFASSLAATANPKPQAP